jgi:hypothetical protein
MQSARQHAFFHSRGRVTRQSGFAGFAGCEARQRRLMETGSRNLRQPMTAAVRLKTNPKVHAITISAMRWTA